MKRSNERSNAENELKTTFRERFCELRGTRSNTEFANDIGMTRQTVGFYLNGDRLPDAASLRLIAEQCGVSTDYLLGLIDIPSRDNGVIAACDYTGLSEEAARSLHKIRQRSPLIEAYSFMISTRKFLDRVATYCAISTIHSLDQSMYRDIPLSSLATLMSSDDYHFAKAIQALQILHQDFKEKFSSDENFVDKIMRRFVSTLADKHRLVRMPEYNQALEIVEPDYNNGTNDGTIIGDDEYITDLEELEKPEEDFERSQLTVDAIINILGLDNEQETK